MTRISLKPELPISRLKGWQFLAGLSVGFLFGFLLYVFGHVLADAAWHLNLKLVSGERSLGNVVFSRALTALEYPPTSNLRHWFAPLWAGVCASHGHAVALFIWARCARERASDPPNRAVTLSLATGWMWIGLIPMLFINCAYSVISMFAGFSPHAQVVTAIHELSASIQSSFIALSPFLIVLLILEPWRGLQRTYRCGWWPWICFISTVGAAGLYTVLELLMP